MCFNVTNENPDSALNNDCQLIMRDESGLLANIEELLFNRQLRNIRL
ncbi:hypothetical protein C725_2108 [Pacificimonas flava]|uniref:Uncharacterized protein n=2 Tax=Pacificimonas flava TaxID=1234595 RepID=M2U333_9SPHN|nr:hypothetical protein C725_2108 [Pacificimonas flava]